MIKEQVKEELALAPKEVLALSAKPWGGSKQRLVDECDLPACLPAIIHKNLPFAIRSALPFKSGQPGPGDAFLKWVLVNQANPARCHRVDISGIAVPDRLIGFDPADTKFIRAALGCPEPRIAEAVDGLRWKRREDFEAAGITVNFLCPEEIKANSDRKHGADVP